MSIRSLTPEEARLIAAYPPHRIKRYPPGASSNWDERPFRERHADLARKAAARRLTHKAVAANWELSP